MDRALRGLKTKPGGRFCTLEYRPSRSASREPSSNRQIILIAIDEHEEALSFFVSPNLAEIIEEEDRQYVDELLQDLRERAVLHPDELFQHLSSLSVGPLVAHKVGVQGVDDQYLADYCTGFVRL